MSSTSSSRCNTVRQLGKDNRKANPSNLNKVRNLSSLSKARNQSKVRSPRVRKLDSPKAAKAASRAPVPHLKDRKAAASKAPAARLHRSSAHVRAKAPASRDKRVLAVS